MLLAVTLKMNAKNNRCIAYTSINTALTISHEGKCGVANSKQYTGRGGLNKVANHRFS